MVTSRFHIMITKGIQYTFHGSPSLSSVYTSLVPWTLSWLCIMVPKGCIYLFQESSSLSMELNLGSIDTWTHIISLIESPHYIRASVSPTYSSITYQAPRSLTTHIPYPSCVSIPIYHPPTCPVMLVVLIQDHHVSLFLILTLSTSCLCHGHP